MDQEELEEQIKAQVEEWSTNSSSCFTIDLIRGDGTKADSFQPEFTYPIFGDEEAIFGYQGLAINLSFAAHNLKPHLGISYDEQYPTRGEVRPTDIHEALRDFLPEVAFSNETPKDALRDEQAASFKPPGRKIHSYSMNGHSYEIWCANLSDPAARQLLENMQILMPMSIEGGSTLQIEQDWTTERWKLFLLYEVLPKPNPSPTYSPYSLIGYGTSYRVFAFPDRQKPLQPDIDTFSPNQQSILDFLPPPETAIPNDLAPTAHPNNMSSPLDLPSRERLSQFLILPGYQRSGYGQELYNTMYHHLTSDHNVREFTVEDPNEAFDDLRDLCDLLYLRTHNPEFTSLRINTSIPPAKLGATTHIPTDLIVSGQTRESILQTFKIDPRQFNRLVEMHTLSFIPPNHRSRNRITRKEKSSNENDRAYYFWRLYVKQRLYIFNRDQLAQLEQDERVEKLEAALDSVQEAYGKMIERVEGREREGRVPVKNIGGLNGDAEAGATRVRPSKRKIVTDGDDEDENMEDGGVMPPVHGTKKPRIELA